jgi:PAS domain S-box-containing protein
MEIVKQTQKPVVMEHTHYNGGTKNFEIHCYPVLSAEKKVKQVIEYTLDITTRKRAEEELRKLSRAVEQSPSTIAITDTNGNFEYVNPKFTELTGYTLEEIKGENPRILKSGYQPEELYKKMWKVISAGNEWRGEFCNKKKNGEIYWEYASISPVRNSSGDITHYLKVSEDITDRKKAEKALQESEEKFRMLFTSEKDAIALIDMDTGKILEVNPAWLELYGYTKAEALELTIADISAEPQKTKAAMEKVRREGSIQISERWHKNKNGKTFPVEISAGTFVWKGRKVTSSIARDITERKETEEKLKKAQEIAEAGNRAKSEFLANMSHEIRTPLNAILGKAETLEEQIYGPLTERQLRALHIIEESGRHLLDLINDILDVSKIEAGKLELYIEEISVRSICQISLRMIKQMAHKKNITVHEDIDSSHERIQADERRLKQILVNLLSNAVKFTPEGGDVGLKFNVKEEDNLAIFEIWDKGIGISEEDARKLFEPFVQLDNRLSREQVGTGLGLSLVFRLTELHNGSVSLKSHVGKGSTFIICIPWKQPDRVKQENSDTQFIEIQKQVVLPPNWKIEPSEYQILLVEDNKSNIATIKDYLAEKGYHISVAENGIQAVEMAREIRPDLIIMDIQLPKMDGLEATTLLKQSEKCKDIPIIALSALTMNGDKEKALNVGVDEYIVKPVSLKNLNGKVIKTLTKKKIESIES